VFAEIESVALPVCVCGAACGGAEVVECFAESAAELLVGVAGPAELSLFAWVVGGESAAVEGGGPVSQAGFGGDRFSWFPRLRPRPVGAP
jgi:hypothetical protein